MNFRKTFLQRVSSKTLYLTTFVAILAIAAVALAFMPTFNGASQAAIEKVAQNPGDERASAEMLRIATNLKSASTYQVLAAQNDGVDAKTKKDLHDAFMTITQLPCSELKDSNLGGKSFAPGVYCVDAAQLAGQMTLDGEDNASSNFIFLVRGDFNAKAGSAIALTNRALAANVYFVADNSATLAEGIEFNGNLVVKNNINVDNGTSIRGKVISVLGDIKGATVDNNLGGGTGTIQICKVTAPSTVDISGRFYRFTVSGVPGVIEVFVPPFNPNAPTPPGLTPGSSRGCSAPFDAPQGNQTITELAEARLPNQTTPTFTSFQLINVQQTQPSFPIPANFSRLGVVNLGTRQAAVTVVEGGPEATSTFQFTNQFAIIGYVEICKQRATGPALSTAGTRGFPGQTTDLLPAAVYNPPVAGTTIPSGGDQDVQGTFNFQVEGVYAQNQLNAPNPNTGSVTTTREYQTFPVATGMCSGAIAVTISNPLPTATPPRESRVRVTELARPGFFLETVTTRPSCDRELQDDTNAGAAGDTTRSQPVICPAPTPAPNNQPFQPGNTTGTSVGQAAFDGGPSTTNGGEVLGARIVPPTAITTNDPAPGPNAPRGTVSYDNVGGGYATVRVIEGSAANMTILDFFNRSNPGTVKICKIAGPGIPEGTLFRYSVFGPFGTIANTTGPATGTTGPTPPAAGAAPNHPQFSTYGPVSTIVDVTAGNAATGGNCVLVPGLGAGFGRAEYQTFINGTPVVVVENGVSPLNQTIIPPGEVRTSRIRVFGPATGNLVLQSGTTAPTVGSTRAGFSPNQCAGFSATNNCSATNGLATAANGFNASGDTAPAGFGTGVIGRAPGNTAPAVSPRIGRVAFFQRPGEVVAEFVNFLFNPTILKICKVAAGGLAPGGTFTFTTQFTPTTAGAPGGPLTQPGNVPIFPGSTTGGPTLTTTVIAGTATAQNPFGNCAVVDAGTFPGGAINIGSDIIITEAAQTGVVVQRVETPTSGGGAQVNTTNRTIRLFGAEGVVPGVTEVAFFNQPATVTGEARAAFDFDGDGKSDASVFRPSTGTWSYAASGSNNEIRSARWGVEGDRPVAADYDGDGKSDLAVFRGGMWFINGSAGAFRAEPFGQAGDIPQPGDYDGDGKADPAVFRPSNGTWYMLGSRSGMSAIQFGITTDRPVAADYDGDGKTDQAVYRIENGNGFWYMNKSRDGFAGVNWGLAADTPVPADYDGDRKADVAVYRLQNGTNGFWYTLKSDGTFGAVNWGLAADKPVPADYDGDGKADRSVFRNGMWYTLPTSNTAQGFTSVQLGNGSDIAIPASLQ